METNISNKCKAYTSLEQSKHLAKFLPLESADMHSEPIDDGGDMVIIVVAGLGDKTKSNYCSPVWSLAALLDIIPEGQVNRMTSNGKWMAVSWPPEHYYIAKDYDSAVDACYALILKLHEQDIL